MTQSTPPLRGARPITTAGAEAAATASSAAPIGGPEDEAVGRYSSSASSMARSRWRRRPPVMISSR